MANISLPFSGDVTQAINPWNLFLRTMSQVGLININIGKSSDPSVEQDVLEEVGSYGRQLGRLSDAVEVLLGTLDQRALSEDQLRAVMAFKEQLEGVRNVKARRRDKPEPKLSEPPPKLLREAVPGLGVKSVAG